MKNILVPTDFSACANNAVDAAYQLAERFESKVHLLHAIPRDLPGQDEAEWMQEVANANILLKDIRERYPAIDTTALSIAGKLPALMKEYVQANSIDLIVMGSHGAGGKQEYFIGSNTQKSVRSVYCPVLVVKDKIEDLNFDKVVFASNFNRDEMVAFMVFKDFVKHFIPEIHLVMVHTSSLFDPPYSLSKEAMKDFEELCAPFAVKSHIHRDFTIEKGIRSFSDEIGASLIGISNHYRHPLKRMLVGSNVEALVNHSNLPVLSIDYLQTKKA